MQATARPIRMSVELRWYDSQIVDVQLNMQSVRSLRARLALWEERLLTRNAPLKGAFSFATSYHYSAFLNYQLVFHLLLKDANLDMV